MMDYFYTMMNGGMGFPTMFIAWTFSLAVFVAVILAIVALIKNIGKK